MLPKAISEVVAAFERMPGIGPKSATRIAFYLLNTPVEFVSNFAKTLTDLKEQVGVCPECFGVSENDRCEVCSDDGRRRGLICVVERAIDVIALEKVGGFAGVYHVLGGVINPLEHVGPEDLKIYQLISRVERLKREGEMGVEIIIATNPTMEGEATALYIKRKLEGVELEGLKITRIGSGLPIGANLEFADQATLAQAMEGRREL